MTRTKLALCAALVATGFLATCSRVPEFEEVRDGAESVHMRGPLTPNQSSDILDHLKRENPDSDILTRHLAIEEAVAGNPLSPDNKITLLQDGEATFNAIFGAVREARDHINLEFFIFEDIEHRGEKIVDLLVAKQGAGVQVNVIYDSIGSEATPGEVFDRLRDAGAKVHEFNPVIPFTDAKPKLNNPNLRDHRKILVVDGRLAITGGINISSVYSASGGGSSPGRNKDKTKSDKPPAKWRDTDLLVEGPAVADFQGIFLEVWQTETGEAAPERNYFPKLAPKGDEVIRIIASGPDTKPPPFYITLLSAIRTAEERIWLANAYFAPTDQEVEDLIAAAKRGVDVRLILQGESDSPIVRHIAHSHYTTLLKAGIRIYELQDAILHSKTIVIDNVWSVVGSSNIDTRSVLFNTEVDTVILGRDTARQMEDYFTTDMAQSTEIVLADWRNRPFADKLKEFFSRVASHWM